MKQFKIQWSLFALTVVVFSCGENAPVENVPTAVNETIQTVQDSVTTLTTDQPAEEELLAENLEPVTDEAPDYVETELKDVVLTRKTPMPANSDESEDIFGTDENGGVSGTGWGDGKTMDRKVIQSPAIVNPTEEEGIVSVKVKVDSDGNVVEATVLQAHHTNTSNSDLFHAATKYARQYKFEPDASVFVSNQIIDIRFE